MHPLRSLFLVALLGVALVPAHVAAQPSKQKLGRFGLENWVKACSKPPAKYYITTPGALQEGARLWAVYYERKERKEKKNPKPPQSRKAYADKGAQTIATVKAEFPHPFLSIYLKHFPATATWYASHCYAYGNAAACRKEAKFWSTYDFQYTKARQEVDRECRLARKQLGSLEAEEKRKKEEKEQQAAERQAEKDRQAAERQAEKDRQEAERIAAAKAAEEKRKREEFNRQHEKRAAEMRAAEQALIESGAKTSSGESGESEKGLTLTSSSSKKDKDKEGEGGEGEEGESSGTSGGDSGGTWGAASPLAEGKSRSSTTSSSRGKNGSGSGGGGAAAVNPGALSQMASLALSVGAVLGITYVIVKLGELGGGVSLNARSHYGFGQENAANSLLGGNCPDGLSCGSDALAGGSLTMSMLVGDWIVAGADLGIGWSASPGSLVTVTSLHPTSATEYLPPVTRTHELGGGSYGLFGFSGGVGHVGSWLVRGGVNFGLGFDTEAISHRDIYASFRYAITDNVAVDLRATFLWQDRYELDFGDRVECDVVGTGNQCLESIHSLQMGGMMSDDLSDAGLVKYPFTIGIGLELFKNHKKRKGGR